MNVQDYVRAVVALYVAMPETPDSARRSDRDLAAQLHVQNIALSTIRTALLLASARRLARSTPLPPIRSLHYFLLVIAEVHSRTPPPSYADYLDAKITQLLDTTGAR